ncbi:Protein kinase domain-containing protein [Caenorhabditis elegans]|uniref:Protein kinase domain-containing protein n=1 Tax=Caenorhabditis elegans TaxID=6239 RepID=Q20643_CAEEL|nr:Protein kinase domain-containing protein [Caenorhabditis elegans]CAA99854.2 Protein kinase domain-containing protein [Caenorhabditis elegans]|eukprot:NP_492259.1 Uncharacterized protein CELE_F52B5.2 [Caenorhabditis elegans]
MDNEKKSMYEPGVILGGCTLRRQLNDSGEAMVFLAESGNEEKKEVIIKFFKCGYGEDEIKYLDVLTNHEQRRNIVEMLKSFETPEIRLGMVFKRYETDLFGILGDRQRLQPSTIQKYMKGLMEGLQFIHRMDYIHRDIKPENLLIDGETICIADFGETVLSTSDKVVKPGTLPYLTIEHILGYKENTKSMDIWAAACVLGAMFQGSHLFSQNSNLQTIHAIRLLLGNHTKETWPEMDKLPLMQSIELPPVGEKTFSKIENITKEAADLMEQMMKYDPTKRLMASQVLNHEYFKKEASAQAN